MNEEGLYLLIKHECQGKELNEGGKAAEKCV